MRAVKIIAIVALVYVGIVVVFESLLGYFQPANQSTLVITTTNQEGVSNDRVLSRLESAGQVYVAVNHWPRAWYTQALANPNVEVTFNGETNSFIAVPVTEEEHDMLNTEHAIGLMFRVLMGFPPRYFVRLDPQS